MEETRRNIEMNRELTEDEKARMQLPPAQQQQQGGSQDPSFGPLPEAYADVGKGIITVPKYNTAYMRVSADMCTHAGDTNCLFEKRKDGTGWNSVSPTSTSYHDQYGDSSHTTA